MQLTRVSRLLIVFGSSLAILGLMMVSVDPEVQYSVDEIMDDPEKFEDTNIFVRGIVAVGSMDTEDTKFILEGNSQELFVDFSNSPIPDGFDEGRTIAVRGLLHAVGDIGAPATWVIDSIEIQTGCPSKYEA